MHEYYLWEGKNLNWNEPKIKQERAVFWIIRNMQDSKSIEALNWSLPAVWHTKKLGSGEWVLQCEPTGGC